ncbi:glycerophosphodiester phosphodiesterase [Marinitenerispora sediminis]|uniref:Glycerophosphodiester phosphodiesterase n=1 Tax=Marinitenerispora sediminis TaxID=1931232 RepID=A0A368T248_9ACTN|nr:glycerophosphodiester phosphodiesterase [Marinitenerispora sediminis]RCV49790.1 glycerophosphodiester phosphodiesterase [Marinitenerispora sediminis]RCV50206.1 glycerophosphodiester phosphodiesterase [Marinitenerispora sediminis]RCV55202.1 glycerophosphodiester phosphodiesterase [Marinitenerispora sediminis]
MTLAIAHRGDPIQFRENTLPALRAGAAAGADMIEIDLKLTADGHVVLLHDDTLDRFWGLNRPVTEVTLAELAALGDGRDRRIPTLMEVLAEFSRPTAPPLMLDVTAVDAALAADDLVAEHDMLGRVLYSGSVEALRAIRGRRPRAQLALSWDQQGFPPPEVWQALRPRYYNSYWPLLTRELVAEVHRHGYAVSAWTVNDLSEMARLIGMGVDAIITDQPAELAKLVGNQPQFSR